LYVDIFCKYEDFAFFEFIVICEHHHCGQLPFIWVAHENEANFNCLLIWHSILVIRSICSIIMVEGVYIHVHHSHEIEMFHAVKATCSKATTKLCFELSHRFPKPNHLDVVESLMFSRSSFEAK
jgi:hypothetical protein